MSMFHLCPLQFGTELFLEEKELTLHSSLFENFRAFVLANHIGGFFVNSLFCYFTFCGTRKGVIKYNL